MKTHRMSVIGAVALWIAGGLGTASAVDYYWNGSTNAWNTNGGAAWVPAGNPQLNGADNVFITNGFVSYTATNTGGMQANDLTAKNGSAVTVRNGATLSYARMGSWTRFGEHAGEGTLNILSGAIGDFATNASIRLGVEDRMATGRINVVNATLRHGDILRGGGAANGLGFILLDSARLEVVQTNKQMAALIQTTLGGSGAVVHLASATVSNFTLAATLGGTGALTLTAVPAASGVANFNLTAANSYSGGTKIGGGLRANASQALAFGLGSVIVSNTGQAYLNAGGGVYPNNFTIVGNGWAESAGTLGAIRLQNMARVAGAVTLSAGARVSAYNSTGYIDGAISGPFQLDKGYAGLLVLDGNNSYGATLVSGGTLQVGTNTTAGTLGTGDVTVNSGCILAWNRSDLVLLTNKYLGSGTLGKLGDGTLRLDNTLTDQLADTLKVDVDQGILDLNGVTETINLLSGDVTGVITNTAGTRAVLVMNLTNAGNAAFAGSLGGDVTVVVTNSVTKNTHYELLSGINQYTGGTVIDNGHLRAFKDAGLGAVPGSFDATNVVIMNNGVLQNHQSELNIHANRGIYLANGTGTIYAGWSGNPVTVTVNGAISGPGTLRKWDGGPLVLKGSNTHTGATTVEQGKLRVDGTIDGSSWVAVSGGATLAGFGRIVPTTTNYSGTLLSPGDNWEAGTLAFDNDLYLTGATYRATLAETGGIGGGTNDLVAVNGIMTLDGSNTVDVIPMGSSLEAGTYTLATAAVMTASLANLGLTVGGEPPANFRQALALSASATDLTLTVVDTAYPLLVWSGGAGGVWDVTGNFAWNNDGDQFYQFDRVEFTDTALVWTAYANISEVVRPRSVTVLGSNDFFFGGSQRISGDAWIAKGGTGMLTISNANDFAGTVTVTGGAVRTLSATALGNEFGGTYVSDGGTLDTFGQNLSYEAVTISGWGVGGTGAVVNTAGGQNQTLKRLSLSGDAAVGGINRWDVRGNGTIGDAWVEGGTNTLYKVGPNVVGFTSARAVLGDIVVSQGVFTIEASTTLNPEYDVILAPGAGFRLWNEWFPLARDFTADYGRIFSEAGDIAYGTNTISGTITVPTAMTNGNGNVILAGPVVGSGQLVKAEGGTTVLLSDGNTFSGGITINAGTLRVGNNTAAGSLGPSPVTNNAVLQYARSDSALWTNPVLGAGTISKVMGGTLQLDSTQPDQVADTQKLDVDAGTLDLNGSDETVNYLTGDAAGTVTNSGGSTVVLGLNLGSAAGEPQFNGTIAGPVQVKVMNSGRYNVDAQWLNGANTFSGGLVVDGGQVRLTTDAAAGALPGGFDFQNITLMNGGILQNRDSDLVLHANRGLYLGGGDGILHAGWVANNRTFTINGRISGAGRLVKWDEASVTLNGDNIHSGGTVVQQGRLILNAASGVSLPSDVTISNTSANATYAGTVELGKNEQIGDTATIRFATQGGTQQWAYLKLMGFSETVAAIQGDDGRGVIENVENDNPVSATGTLTLNGPGDSYFNGYMRNRAGLISAGLLALGKGGTGTATLVGANITYTGPSAVSGETLALSNTTAFASPWITNDARVQFGLASSFTQTYRGVISGTGSAVKEGAGVLILTTNNTFAGNFTANGGLTILSGQNTARPAGRGDLVVNTGAVVQSTGDNPLGQNAHANGFGRLLVSRGRYEAASFNHVNEVVLSGGQVAARPSAAQIDGMDLRALTTPSNRNPTITVLSETVPSQWRSVATLSATATVDVADGIADEDLQVASQLKGASKFVKAGAGVMTLAAKGANSGGIDLDAGTLLAAGGETMGSGTVALNGGTLVLATAPASITGFGGDGMGWGVNGAAVVAADQVQMTQATGNLASAMQYLRRINVASNFTLSFAFRMASKVSVQAADGYAVVFHNDPRGAGAVGQSGGQLGFAGTGAISNSIAALFSFYQVDKTTFGTNGVAGAYVNLSPTNMLDAGDWVTNTISYAPGLLTVQLDSPSGTVVRTLAVDLETMTGSKMAFLGLTAGTGGSNSEQLFTNLTFAGSSLPVVHSNVVAVPAGGTGWLRPQPVSGAQSFALGGMSLGAGAQLDVAAAAGSLADSDYLLALSGGALGGAGTVAVANHGAGMGAVSLGAVSGVGGALTKSDAGRLTLTDTNTYDGATTVAQGTLALGAAGYLPASPVIAVASSATFDVSAIVGGYFLPAGQTLQGNGLVNGDVWSAAGSVVTPGASAGRLTLDDAYVCLAGSTCRVELAGTTQGATYDHLAVNGAATLGGDLEVLTGAYVPAPGNVYTVLTAAAGVSGVFANAPSNNAPIAAGTNTVYVQYGSNEVVLAVSTVDPDNDGDGLPASSDPNDSNPDSDGDGLWDGPEFWAFGNAMSAYTKFTFTNEVRAGTGTVLTWPAISSRYYRIFSTLSPTGGIGAWTNVVVTLPPHSDGKYTNPVGPKVELYRIEVRLNP